MQTLDRLWRRAPQEVDSIFGDDITRALQDWQAIQRYHTPEQLAEYLRQRARDDPQVRERRQRLETTARTIAGRVTIDRLLSDLDPGWFQLEPNAPMDGRTREAALGDYTRLFVERYVATGDEATARQQAIERMRLVWGRSDVNGGRLTMYPPERAYRPIRGSHQWMRDELVRDLTSLGIDPMLLTETPPPSPAGPEAASDFTGRPTRTPPEFSLHSDARTETDVANGRPASYLVMMRRADGRVDMARDADGRPQRYFWAQGEPAARDRDEFRRQRERILGTGRNSPILGIPSGWGNIP
jgi:hypothetical protein